MIDFLAAQSRPSGGSRGDGETILFVFPHPDDDVFVGGTLSLLARAGARVDAVWMTSGGFDGGDHVREDEMRRAMDAAGVERRHLLRLPDGGMIGALPEACAMLHRLVAEVRPRAVVGPAFEGGHADHDATSFALVEACRRAKRDVGVFEYPCYAPDVDAANGLRLGAFPADTPGIRRVRLDKAAMRCKASMVDAYASQKQVFELLGWRASSEEYFRECPSDRDYRRPPCRGLDSYAHWFNRRSQDRFEQLAAAIASCSPEGPPSEVTVAGGTLRFRQTITGSD